MRSPAVKRIDDVRALRMRQFPRGCGATGHPVQPQALHHHRTISTRRRSTKKGAEVIGMLKTLVDEEGLPQGDRPVFRPP